MPYTTEQINIVSKMVRLQGASIENALETLGAFERFNGGEKGIFVDERTGEVVGNPLAISCIDSRHYGYYRLWGGTLVKRHASCTTTRYYADRRSAQLDGWVECEECGDWFRHDDPESLTISGSNFCSCDCAYDAGWETCDWCGDWVHVDDAVRAGDYVYCSEACTERDGWARCDRCGEWELDGNVGSVIVNGNDECWCNNCYENYAAVCHECGEARPISEMHEIGYYWYCDDCADGCDSVPTWNILPTIKLIDLPGSLPGPHIGVELETDGDCRHEYISDLDAIDGFGDMFWMGDDGSLSEDGVELKSQPMTLAKHESIRGTYEQIGSVAREHGYTSHDNGRCGIHLSVNRDWFGKSEVVQDAHIYKMMRLLQRFERQFTTFSRRLDNHWCQYSTHLCYAPHEAKVDVKSNFDGTDNLLSKSKRFKSNETEKYQAVNIRHKSHVEIRIFRGTLRWSTYFASLALVDGLARLVKLHGSIWVESVTWYELADEIIAQVRAGGNEFSAKCLEEYMAEKSLR